jgi:hypothetical protein
MGVNDQCYPAEPWGETEKKAMKGSFAIDLLYQG